MEEAVQYFAIAAEHLDVEHLAEVAAGLAGHCLLEHAKHCAVLLLAKTFTCLLSDG